MKSEKIRIAFLGSDSTHTEAFAKLINSPQGEFFPQAEVVAIWGENSEQTQTKAKAHAIKRVCATPQEALQDVDLAMVIGRFGNSHLTPAKLGLEMKVPTFVDKPFTCCYKEALEIAAVAEVTHTPLCSSSPLRFAKEVCAVTERMKKTGEKPISVTVSAPAKCVDMTGDSRFLSPYFYGIHGVEMLLQMMGDDVVDVKFDHSPKLTNARLDFGDGRSATLNLVEEAWEFYSFTAIFKEEAMASTIALDGSYYERELEHILQSFYSEQKGISVKSTLEAISILERAGRM